MMSYLLVSSSNQWVIFLYNDQPKLWQGIVYSANRLGEYSLEV